MPPRARATKPKPAPVEETVADSPTPVEETVAADAPSPTVEPAPAVDAPPVTVEEFRVRAVTSDGDEFLVRGGRLYASRADADSAVTTDRRRYRWPSAPAEPAYVVEVRTVARSPWVAVD